MLVESSVPIRSSAEVKALPSLSCPTEDHSSSSGPVFGLQNLGGTYATLWHSDESTSIGEWSKRNRGAK